MINKLFKFFNFLSINIAANTAAITEQTIVNRYGKLTVSTQVIAATKAETTAVLCLIAGIIKASNAKGPANPKPQELGMSDPKKIAINAPICQKIQWAKIIPKKYKI